MLFVLLAGCERDTPSRAVAPSDAGLRGQRSSVHPLVPVVAPDLDATVRDATPNPASVQLSRGEYLVRHVAACGECHTPRLPSGELDTNKLLSGVENLIDVEPGDDARGLIHSRNLTPDGKTGLGMWSDDQIKKAFQHGVDDEGKTLHWMMPYWIFRNMRDADADAIVAFLRSVPPRVHDVPENQPNAVDPKIAPYELPSAEIPDTTLDATDPDHASAERGKYLATSVAPCALCHSPTLPSDSSVPIDPARMFAGKRALVPVRLGTPAPPGSPMIDTYNLTPHANGIFGWSAGDVATVLRQGVSKDSLPVCDPMPSYM
ncbi:MAG: c-type cytochrome, partial [Polyangiales bacterium]